MNKHDISKRLTLLREQMSLLQIDVFIAMSADPHMSEYLPDFWKIREWLTAFCTSHRDPSSYSSGPRPLYFCSR